MKYYRIAWINRTTNFISWGKWTTNKNILEEWSSFLQLDNWPISYWLETENTTPLAQSMLTPHF